MIDAVYRPEISTTELEGRVRRLEQAVSALSDTQLMESRVADQVVQRLKRSDSKSSIVLDDPNRRNWFFVELWDEVRTLFRMVGDHRYPMTFLGRFGPFAVMAAYVFVYLLCGMLPLIGWLLERALVIVLVVIFYKILSREVARYRAMFPERS